MAMLFNPDPRKQRPGQVPDGGGLQAMGLGQIGQIPQGGGLQAGGLTGSVPGGGGSLPGLGQIGNPGGLNFSRVGGDAGPEQPSQGYQGPAMQTNNGGLDLGTMSGTGGFAGSQGPLNTDITGPGQPMPPQQTNRFNLDGAQVHGRAADTRDPNDLLWLASQQQGFDISSTDAAQRTYRDIIQPMFQQQGINANLTGRNMDRLDLGGGRTMDFIVGAAGADAGRSFGITDSANPGPAAPQVPMSQTTMAGGGGPVMPPTGPGMPTTPQPAPAAGPSAGAYEFNPISGAQDYTPQAVQGPDPLSVDRLTQPGAVAADQVGPGQQVLAATAVGGPAVQAAQAQAAQAVQAGTAQAGPNVNAERIAAMGVGGPERIAAQQVQGPGALGARNVADPTGFQNLTADQLAQDPSYQFRLQQGLGAMQNSAAARGLLRTGGTVKALGDYAGQSASQEYAAANDRARQTYQQNFANQAGVVGQNNAAQAQAYGLTNQYQQAAQLANQGANLGAAQFNSQQGQQAGMFNASQGQQAQSQNASNALNAGQFNSAQQQQVGLANIGNQLQAGMFNAGNQQQTNLANAANQQQAGMFNSGQQQQNQQFNAGNQQQAQQFNSAQGQQAALANQGANLQAGQFNAGMNFNTQQQNAQNQIAAYNAYQPLRQQAQQFNEAQRAASAQNNFQNRFAVDQFNSRGGLDAFNANLGAELGRGNLGVSQGQLALGNRSADMQNAISQGQLALGNRQADQSFQLGLGNLGVSQGHLGLAGQGQSFNQGMQEFGVNQGVYRDNRDTAFNQQLELARLGYGAAGNYGNNAADLYANQGQANAGAAIGQGNAWANGLGQLGQGVMAAGMWNAQNQQPDPWQNSGAIPWNGAY